MNQYELMVIIDPDIGTETIQKRLSKVRDLITSQKGEITFEDIWGLRDLAYTIKKKDRGYYAVLDFGMEGEGLQEIDTTLKLDNEVLRHMVVGLPSDYKSKSYLAELDEEEEVPAEKKGEDKKAAPVKVAKKEAVKPADTPVKATKEEAKEEKAEAKKEVKEEKTEKTAEKKAVADPTKAAAKKEKSPSLEEVDQKLKDIIDNPDLNF